MFILVVLICNVILNCIYISGMDDLDLNLYHAIACNLLRLRHCGTYVNTSSTISLVSWDVKSLYIMKERYGTALL